MADQNKIPSLSTDCCENDSFDSSEKNRRMCWFVMRDLKRSNSKLPAYKQLRNEHFEVFIPMKWRVSVKKGKQVREEVPFIQDLLFVHSTKEKLDPVVAKTSTLQYRYLRGVYCEPMIVSEKDMDRFIQAVQTSDSPRYYLPEELTTAMCGRRIRIAGGPLSGCEGRLLTIRGSKVKRLLIELSCLFSVAVEVDPELIEFI